MAWDDRFHDDQPQRMQADTCSVGGEPIYVGDEYYDIGNCAICEGHIDQFLKDAKHIAEIGE